MIESCNGCGILSCHQSKEGWKVSDGQDRTVTFSPGLNCEVRDAVVNKVPVEGDEALKDYMVHLLHNIGMPDIARLLQQRVIFLSSPSGNNSVVNGA